MMQQFPETEAGTLIQSVQRAARVLKAFEGGPATLGVNEVSRRVDLHKSTVSRLLATLEREGLVERAPDSDKYRLGHALVRLAGQVTHGADVREVARPILSDLADQSQETVHLALLDGDEALNVEQLDGPHFVLSGNWVGRRTPLNGVANGKALLAWSTPEVIARVLDGPLPRFTARTITDARQLRDELAAVRARGYATALGEIEEGMNAVAAPVLDAQGWAIAAVSVSGPAYRVTPERLPELGKISMRAAAKIGARMGF